MVKGKKNIKDFQNALKSNTSFISASEEEEAKVEKKASSKKTSTAKKPTPKKRTSKPEVTAEHNLDLIDKDVLQKIDILADYMNHTPGYLVNLALNHFLGLKLLRMEEALEAHEAKKKEEN